MTMLDIEFQLINWDNQTIIQIDSSNPTLG